MIKNIILTAVIIIGAMRAGAQTCTPDTSLKVAGFLPAVLPAATAGEFYNEGISVLTFRDTYRMVGTLKIPVKLDSIRVTGIAGLPAGISYKCQHPRCIYLWDTVRCVSLYGTPSQSGSFPIKIYIRAFGKLGGATSITQNDSISRFTMQVNGGTVTLTNTEMFEYKVFPVPAGDELFISGPNAAELTWTLTDISGREIPVRISAGYGVSVMDLSSVKAGIYIIRSGDIAIKFTKQAR